jgi:hypothetical protein
MAFYEINPQSLYPAGIDQFITKKDARVIPPGVSDTGEWVMAGHVNHIQNAIIKIEGVLGTNPQGGYSNVSERLDQILGGFSSLTRLGYYKGNPRMAGTSGVTPWPNVSKAYPYFKTINYLFYEGSFSAYGTNILAVKENCDIELSIKLERDQYTNSIDANELLRWRNAGQNKFFVIIDNITAGDNYVLNSFIANVKAYNVILDLVFLHDFPDSLIIDLQDNLINLSADDGLFVFGYLENTARIHTISEMLTTARALRSVRIGALSYFENTDSLYDEYFFGLGLNYIYRLDYFGLADFESGSLKNQSLCLYPYLPLNINYMSSNHDYNKSGDTLTKVVEDYNLIIDFASATLSSSLLKIPSSFIYFDKNTFFDASIIESGTFNENVKVTPLNMLMQANKIFFTGNDAVFNELSLGSNETFLMSNGPMAAPTWERAVRPPLSSTDNNIAVFSGISGNLLKDSTINADWFNQDVTTTGEPTFASVNVTDGFYINGEPFTNAFLHEQTVPSNLWIITHNKNTYPSVTIIDSLDEIVFADIEYISPDQLTISFTSEETGKAYIF